MKDTETHRWFEFLELMAPSKAKIHIKEGLRCIQVLFSIVDIRVENSILINPLIGESLFTEVGAFNDGTKLNSSPNLVVLDHLLISACYENFGRIETKTSVIIVGKYDSSINFILKEEELLVERHIACCNGFIYLGPLMTVISNRTVGAIIHAHHRWVEILLIGIKLRQVDVLCLS